MGRPAVFLDSSVVIAALLSVKGGSSYILREVHERFSFQINEHALAEIQEALGSKFKDQSHLPTVLFLLLGTAEVQTVLNPPITELAAVSRIISKKDAPILVSAMQYCDFLLTLDNEFFKSAIVNVAKEKDLVILKPGDFIRLFDL